VTYELLYFTERESADNVFAKVERETKKIWLVSE